CRLRPTLYDVPRHYRLPDGRVAWAIFIAVGSALHVAAQSPTADPPSFHVSVGPQEIVLSNEEIVQNKLWSWPDGLLGILKSGETYRFIGPQGGNARCHGVDGQPAEGVGTLDHPIRDGITRCMAIENMRNSYTYTGAGPVYTDP